MKTVLWKYTNMFKGDTRQLVTGNSFVSPLMDIDCLCVDHHIYRLKPINKMRGLSSTVVPPTAASESSSSGP